REAILSELQTRVCPRHGGYEPSYARTGCPNRLVVRMFVGLPEYEIDCPGVVWEVNNPPSWAVRMWRSFCVWVREN
ncbi:hypothetical protein LCGC14_1144110, partial [marine sediment metagenome]